jgi:uncharacterized protein (DUF885 family)
MVTSTEQFYADSQAFIAQFLEGAPVTATLVGDHRYDDRLSDYTPAALARYRQLLEQWQARFKRYDAQEWSPGAQIDHILMTQLIKRFIRDLDKLRILYRHPGEVVGGCLTGVHLLTLRNSAPLPVRMKSVLGRLRHIPRVLAEGRALIEPSKVPPVWAETALETTRQGVGLFTDSVTMLAQATPDLKEDIVTAAQTAAAALNEHAAWIEQVVLPQAAGDFAVGQELFDELLREDHMVEYNAEELLATGWRLYAETEQQIKALAAQIDARKTAQELLQEARRDHPTAEELLDAYRQKIAEARQFVLDHDIVTIPQGERLRIELTPPFRRPIIPHAAYMTPGFMEKWQEGVFIITPPQNSESGAAKVNSVHAHVGIPLTVLHEAYPGHHLQTTFANAVGSPPRKMGSFLSSLFIEGWAFYCEELMEQAGFIHLPIQRLVRLQAQLVRASRIIIDVSLHLGQMSVEEAILFLTNRAGQEPDSARAEVRRYTQHPAQPQSYLMGKIQLLDIIAEYKRRYPQASMRQMHDAILQCGPLPPKLMRLCLFGP